MPRYTAKLYPGSFRELAEKVRKYRLSLNDKCEEFVYRLSEIGLQKAKSILIEHIETGQTIGSLRIENDSDGKVTKIAVVVESNAILFLEFGTGVVANSGEKIQKQVNWGMDQELILMEKKEKDTGMTLMAGGIKKKRVASGITLMVLKPVCQCIKPA